MQINLGGTDLDLGRATMANSLSVTMASDQPALAVTGTFSATIAGFTPSGDYSTP